MSESKKKNTKSTSQKKASSSTKKKELRLRNFEIVNQIDESFDIKEFEERIRAIPYISKYAFIIHDKDYKDEAKTKKAEPHYHLQCACNNSYAVGTIAGWLDVRPSQIERIKANFAVALLYLTHLNAPDKHQYEDTEVHANFAWQKERKEAKSRIIRERQKTELITAILSGQVKQYGLYDYFDLKEIDRNYIVFWDRDIRTAFKHRSEMITLNPDRNLQSWFIYGKSGVGKTVLAKILAEKRGYMPFITSSDNDTLDGYAGQECIIFDEIRDDTFKNYDDLLKMTDKHTASRVRSRYQNKVLTDVELIIITSTQSYEEIFCKPYVNEEDKQIKRRISTLIKVDEADVIVSQYNERTGKFEFLTHFKNPLNEYLEDKSKQNDEKMNETKAELKNWFEQKFIQPDTFQRTHITTDAFLSDGIQQENSLTE